MKIIIEATDDDSMWDGYRNSLEIEVYFGTDTKPRRLRFYDGEPEDNNLNRNFNDCYSISGLLQQAFEAGKAGETFEVIEKEPEK